MPGAALVFCLAAGATPLVEAGAVLEADLYPAAVVLAAAEALDGNPNLAVAEGIYNRPIQLHVALPLNAETAPSLRILLLLAGIHRFACSDGAGIPFAWVTTDPARPMRLERRFDVEVLVVEHIDAEAVAAALNSTARQREAKLPAGEAETVFVADGSGRRVVVRCASAERLREYRGILAKLDAAPLASSAAKPRLLLRTWLPRYRAAEEIDEELGRRWDEKSDGEIVAFAAGSGNTLLLRLTEAQWTKAQEILDEIDHR